MTSNTSKTGINLLMLLLSLSIAFLFVNTLFPWLSVDQNIGLNDKQYFNLEMMEDSEIDTIKNFAGKINLINTLLWILIIISLLSLLGITYHSYTDFSIISQYIMALVGIAALVISVLILYIDYTVITSFDEASQISLAPIISHFKYPHLSIIFETFILIFTIFYAKIEIKHSIVKIKKFKPKIEKNREMEECEPEDEELKEFSSATLNSKKTEMEDWLVDEIKNIDQKTIESKTEFIEGQNEEIDIYEQKKLPKEENLILKKDIDNVNVHKVEKKSFQEPFPQEKPKEKNSTDNFKVSESFENALSAAIEKKQSQLKQIQPIDKKTHAKESDKKVTKKEEINQESEKKPLMVKCPQCTHIFSTEKKDGITKIKCPQCGKEGIIK